MLDEEVSSSEISDSTKSFVFLRPWRNDAVNANKKAIKVPLTMSDVPITSTGTGESWRNVEDRLTVIDDGAVISNNPIFRWLEQKHEWHFALLFKIIWNVELEIPERVIIVVAGTLPILLVVVDGTYD